MRYHKIKTSGKLKGNYLRIMALSFLLMINGFIILPD